MRNIRKRSFKELVLENKKELLSDRSEMEKIEDRLVKRAQDKLFG